MIKCSFCEQPLVCRECHRPVRPTQGATHLGIYQPDMAVNCPECKQPLACRHCGFVYGSDENDEDTPAT
jgi:hypothetical protein